jgi:hypothetical protein
MDAWLVPKAPGTHTLMDGGILFVLDEDMDHFLNVYIQELGKNKLYVVEQKTEVFKFFVDLDYKAPEKLSDEFLIKIVKCIHDSLGRPGRCCIARAQPRPVKEGIKSGVHIHWPDLKVTKQQATSNRAKIILDLPLVDGIDWSHVVDSSVYGGSGLRMLWSHKKPSGGPYIPWKTLDGQEFSKEPNVETLSLFSIRCPTSEKHIDQADEVVPATDCIEEFIQRYLPGQRKSQVKKIQRMEEGTDAWYIQTDSKYCERIRDEHRSNHIWFLLSKGRVSQRCFNEECKNFVGSEHILPPSIVDEVVTVGSPPTSSFMDIITQRNTRPVPEVRTGGASLLWPGPDKLETLPQ